MECSCQSGKTLLELFLPRFVESDGWSDSLPQSMRWEAAAKFIGPGEMSI
jgi:hypothetical protein